MIKLFSSEAEKALLGIMLKDSSVIPQIMGYINAKDFYFDEHKKIFSSIEQIYQNDKTVDPIVLLDYLQQYDERDRESWLEFLNELIFLAGIKSNIEQYLFVIKDKSEARHLQNTLQESVDLVSSKQQKTQTSIEEIESKIFNVTRNRELKGFKNVEEITSELFLKLTNFDPNKQDGIKTGIESLDHILGSIQEGDFVVLAARPSVGKTAIALEISKNIALDHHVAFFSLEMPKEQLVTRMLASTAFLNANLIQNMNSLSQKQKSVLEFAKNKLDKLKFKIDDSPSLKLQEISWKARKLKYQNELDILIIDYMQLIQSENFGENRYQSISNISRGLKQLARELKIPIIALAQLSREVEKRQGKPILSDIRDSGAIEQDADIVMFLHREDYQKDSNAIKVNDVEELEIIVAKHRNGPTGIAKTNFSKSFGRIGSLHNTKSND